MSVKSEIEKLKKDEVYLKSQMIQKTVLIEKLQLYIENSETPANLIENAQISAYFNTFEAVLLIVESMQDKIKNVADHFKCVSCFKTSSQFFIFYPCGHLCCYHCKEDLDSLCIKCTERISAILPEIYLEILINLQNKELECIDNIKELVNCSKFNSKV